MRKFWLKMTRIVTESTQLGSTGLKIQTQLSQITRQFDHSHYNDTSLPQTLVKKKIYK